MIFNKIALYMSVFWLVCVPIIFFVKVDRRWAVFLVCVCSDVYDEMCMLKNVSGWHTALLIWLSDCRYVSTFIVGEHFGEEFIIGL